MSYGTDLVPNYRLKNDVIKVTRTEVFLNHSDEYLEKETKAERDAILKRERNFADGVNFYENFEMVDISLIDDTPDGWNLFDKPRETEVAQDFRE